jgi:hypothetical protein
MERRILDQTASERLLHRVLYAIKFLRAMVLHVSLAALAAIVFATTGVTGLYPVADNTIRVLRAGAIEQELEHGSFGGAAFWIATALVVAAAIAALVWIYRSITDVRPKSLRVQAVAIVAVALWDVAALRDELQFAFANLDPAFAVIAALGVGLSLFVFPVNIAVSLWQVSRAPERSSLLATLDPRLAPGRWTYWNKLLDLPRTPLRTGKTLAAYALAVVGALLLVTSMMYLLTLGGAGNRLGTLSIACDAQNLPQCRALSSTWAWQIPLALLLSAAGVKGAALLQSLAKRLGGLSVSDVLKRPDDPFLLYLRPFDSDDVVLPTPRLPPLSRLFSFRPPAVRVEEELFDVADGYRPLIAVGKPGGSRETPGGMAYRDYLDDSVWQDYVADKIRRAERIVLVMKNSEGVRWEIARVVAEGAAPKTLFLFEPTLKDAAERETVARTLVPLLQSGGAAPQGLAFAAATIGFYFRNDTLVEIVNENRTATSYRTAFSHFLAET